MSELIEYRDGYNSENSICLIWCIEDIKGAMKMRDDKIDISDEECMDILWNMESNHDASFGITWDGIDYHLDEFIQDKKEREVE